MRKTYYDTSRRLVTIDNIYGRACFLVVVEFDGLFPYVVEARNNYGKPVTGKALAWVEVWVAEHIEAKEDRGD
jgi:hypothetical protein